MPRLSRLATLQWERCIGRYICAGIFERRRRAAATTTPPPPLLNPPGAALARRAAAHAGSPAGRGHGCWLSAEAEGVSSKWAALKRLGVVLSARGRHCCTYSPAKAGLAASERLGGD